MYNIHIKNNIINKKNIIVGFLSFIFAIILHKPKKKKHTVFSKYKKIFSFISSIFDLIFLKLTKNDVKQYNKLIKIENAEVIDL